ncbi:MAG: hypothetical protein H8E66_24650 [Planctomycetes bacterium]|nr:hypothetical protein [Planctomycetota bacterium]
MGRLQRSLCSGCLLVLVAVSVVMACETPVYRYAMYRWQPAPYEVYFFHEKDASEQDQRVQELLAEFERGSAMRANVACIPVNVAEDPELTTVPPDVKKAWLAREDKELPSYFISTPYGVGLSSERLEEKNVKTLVESPARKSLAAQLETGKLGVFVMLGGKEASENDATEAILSGLVEEVRDGKVSLYVSPTDAAGEGDAAATKPDFDLGFIKIDREDSEEEWFVRSLLAMEPDLAAEERPMVFLVYGRARALLPYIGKGITRENLVREIEFISGACSCTVKEQNPGVDLLVRYDWDSAAAALADKFGNEEGNESQFGPEMFFPELIIPESGSPASTEVATADVDEPITDNTIIEQPEAENAATDTSLTENSSSDVVEATATEALVDPELSATPDSSEVAAIVPTPSPQAPSTVDGVSSSSMTSVWIVGAGIGVALVALFGITFFVLRPQ